MKPLDDSKRERHETSDTRAWELLPEERVLRVHGKPVTIGSRAIDVLMALSAHEGQVVHKSALLDLAWKGLVVEENNLSVQISALRKAIGTDAIKTVAGIGYQLRASPRLVATPASLASVAREAPRDLFGRQGDLESLVERVGALPLVTIVGTGGVGKTALARRLLAARAEGWDDQVYWIDLAPVRETDTFVAMVAKALGVEPESGNAGHERLLAAVSRTQAVIAIDNCEHVLDEIADFLTMALERAPMVRWLATSQAPLRLGAETVYRLRPLDLPPRGSSLDQALSSGALELLLQRARTADRDFVLDESTVETAIDLCRRLDGLPLAIEMAASRIAQLGLRGVHEALGQRLQILTGPRGAPARHLTLRATFDWSYGLLTPLEQAVFVRLQPCVGGFCLRLAKLAFRALVVSSVAVPEEAALAALSGLVDKSLVQHRSGDGDRWFLYESARDYAALRVNESGETERIARHHAEAVGDFFNDAASDYDRMRDDDWAAIYLPERHNVSSALAWACGAKDADLLARHVAALAQIDLFVRGPPEIVRLDVPLDVLTAASPRLRAIACVEFSWALFAAGRLKQASTMAAQAYDDYRSFADDAGAYRALAQLVRLYESRHEMTNEAREAQALLATLDSRTLALRTRLFCNITAGMQYGGKRTLADLRDWERLANVSGFDSLAALCRVHIVDELLINRSFEEAASTAQTFLNAGEKRPRLVGSILMNRTLALVQLGRLDEAQLPARDAMRTVPGRSHVVISILALAAAKAGMASQSAMMIGYSERVMRERDQRLDPAEAAAHAETLNLLGGVLSADQIEPLKELGAAMRAADVLRTAFPNLVDAPRS